MKTNKFPSSFLGILVAMIVVGLASCGSNDSYEGEKGKSLDEVENTLIGWYIDKDNVAKQSDFNIINEAIDNNEVLSDYGYVFGERLIHIASYSEFIGSDGSYTDSDAHFGRLRFKIPAFIDAIRILDDNTLLSYYSAQLFVEGSGSGDAVYKFYAGRIFDDMAYYGKPSYYTYVKMNNKIVVSNGDIYTIVDNGLIPEGRSIKMSKYDPSMRY